MTIIINRKSLNIKPVDVVRAKLDVSKEIYGITFSYEQ